MRILLSLVLLGGVLLTACDRGDIADVPATGGATTSGTAPENLGPIPDDVLAALDSATVRQHLMILSHDSLEGRGTGQPGEEKAILYIAEQMRRAGLEPAGDDGTFFQNVPLMGSTPTPRGPLTFTSEDGEQIELSFLDEFIASTDLEAEAVETEGRLVFVGYGIDAPGYDWNSFKDVDVTDKILLSFVNDPVPSTDEPDLFQGDTLTYYGRWTYKQEEARRRGARGIILIHTLQTAGYPFTVLSNSAGGEQIELQTPPENPLELKAWITTESANELAAMVGSTVQEWFARANDRHFQPVELPVTASVAIDYAVRRFEGKNVIGKIPGSVHPDEGVIFTAHHDHLGIGQPDDEGDRIYNGAVDNASGIAMVLTLAEAFGQAPPPERTLLFATLTAEESGLLGASYYARHPHIPLSRTMGNINIDSGNVYGATEDIVGIGAERSQMWDLLGEAAAAENMTVSGDPRPGQGIFFRSDQLAFARGGVPAIYVESGERYTGPNAEAAMQAVERYGEQQYHQPADEFDPAWPMSGLVQQMRVAARIAHRLGYSTLDPQWNEGEGFGQTRAESRRESQP